MKRVALRGLVARPVRTLLTMLAIVLGVAMVSGAFTLTDTMRGASDSLSSAAYDGTDAVVAGRTAFKVDATDWTAKRPTVDGKLLDTVRAVPQVAVAVGDVSDEAKIVGRDGKPVGDGPYFGVGYDSRTAGAEATTPFRLDSGRWATGPGEVVIDAATAEKQHYALGSHVRVTTPGAAREYTLVGIARFGTVKSLGVATAAVFDLRAAQELFGKGDAYDSILVAGRDGVAAADVRQAVGKAVGTAAQVQTARSHDRFTLQGLEQFISIIRVVLLVFGFVAIFVGAFTIFNTLSITVAQRSREFGLLRMVGAARRQVLGSVMLEALAIGLLASALGLAAGFGIAKGLDAVFDSMDLSLPDAGMVFAGRTVLVSMLVGTLVTLVAGLIPAWRATRVPPVAALHDAEPGTHRLRLPARAVRGLASLLGRPAAWIGGSAGGLARRNAMRHPGRTAATASALMIGVALVTLVTVIAQGLRDTTSGTLDKRIAATHVITGADGWSPTDPAVARAVAEAPGIDGVTAVRQDVGLAFGDKEIVNSIDPATVDGRFSFDYKVGSDAAVASLGRDGAIVDEGLATEHGLTVGKRFDVTSAKGDRLHLTVRAIEKSPVLDALAMGPITISQARLRGCLREQPQRRHVRVRLRRRRARPGPEAVPGRQGADEGRVHRLRDRRHRHAAGDLLRPARARRDREPVRDRQHAGALDVRAHPRAGHAARGRHVAPAGAADGPPRERHHRADGRGARDRGRARPGGDRHLGVRRRGPDVRDPGRLARRPHDRRRPRGRAGGGDPGTPGRTARRAHRARVRVGESKGAPVVAQAIAGAPGSSFSGSRSGPAPGPASWTSTM